jgi:hypothetical protein
MEVQGAPVQIQSKGSPMGKDTVLSSFGKYIEPLHRLKLQEKIVQSNHDKFVKKLTTKAYRE